MTAAGGNLSGFRIAQLIESDGPGGAERVVADLAARSGTDPAGYLSEGPALNAFALIDGAVYQTYSAYSRGLEILMGYYPLLDRVPTGRNEEGQSEFWLRRHDEYQND